MKNIKYTFISILIFIASCAVPVTETKAQSVAISFSTFQEELSPYGRWVYTPRYGQVWIYNDINFRPYYTGGHWDYTNYGWAWVSDYDWGWAPFHYGRWEYDPFYGWIWIPGYEWAPAWVSWSSYDGYYGWAPLGYGISINVSFGSIPYERWTFIPRQNICDRDIYRHYLAPQRNLHFRNSVVINNYYNGSGRVGSFVRGPERREAERYTRNRIQERRIDYADRNLTRNRDNNVRNSNDNNRRRNDAVTQRQRNNANSTVPRVNENRRNQNNDIRKGRKDLPRVNQNTNPANDNNRRRREMNPGNSNTQPVIEKRRPVREVNKFPQRNENTNPGRRQNENRVNPGNSQRNNFPQAQRRNERPAMEQPRKMERRIDNGRNGGRPDNNNQRQNPNNPRKRNGN
jgi:hypothetical protein